MLWKILRISFSFYLKLDFEYLLLDLYILATKALSCADSCAS
jgi:hypothetical protein